MWRRLHVFLAGEDGPGRRALPLGEFLHPAPLTALVLLAVNDHVWKGTDALPQPLIGKISDFAGLLFFPLLLTAIGDTVLCGLARASGRRIDFSLRAWKLGAALAASAAVFVPLELSASYGRWYTETLGKIGFPSATTMDLGDLWALVMLPVAGWLGWREIARVPLGRLEVIERGGLDPVAALADVRRAARDKGAVDELAAALGAKDDARVSAALARLRGGR